MSRVLGLQVPGVGAVRGAVAALVGVDHSGGPVEAVLQEVAHRAEAGQPHPTGAHGAGARHAVALALLMHLRRNGLEREGGREQLLVSVQSARVTSPSHLGSSKAPSPFCPPRCCAGW